MSFPPPSQKLLLLIDLAANATGARRQRLVAWTVCELDVQWHRECDPFDWADWFWPDLRAHMDKHGLLGEVDEAILDDKWLGTKMREHDCVNEPSLKEALLAQAMTVEEAMSEIQNGSWQSSAERASEPSGYDDLLANFDPFAPNPWGRTSRQVEGA